MSANSRTDNGTRRRLFLPIALAIAGTLLLIGCIPVLLPEKVVKGTDYRRVIGDNGQYLEDGHTRRADVEAKLGRAQYQAEGGRFVGYYLQTNSGFWLEPLCFRVDPEEHFRLLTLEYSAEGILVRHYVAKADYYPYIFTIAKADPSYVTRDFPVFTKEWWQHLAETRPAEDAK